jgi:hypothetical protein
MTCNCKGVMVSRNVRRTFTTVTGSVISFYDLPSHYCTRCAKYTFDETVTNAMNDLVANLAYIGYHVDIRIGAKTDG